MERAWKARVFPRANSPKSPQVGGLVQNVICLSIDMFEEDASEMFLDVLWR